MKIAGYVSHLTSLIHSLPNSTSDALAQHLSRSFCNEAVYPGLKDQNADKFTVQNAVKRGCNNNGLEEEWTGILLGRLGACLYEGKGEWAEAYQSQASAVSMYLKVAQSETSWILEPLYSLLRDLRYLASMADATNAQLPNQASSSSLNASTSTVPEKSSTGAMGSPCSEDCARVVNKAFSVCLTDRSNGAEYSRRRGVYRVATMSMKCYFKVDRTTLAKNLIRAASSDPSIPALQRYPIADQIGWRYYLGILEFRNGEDAKANEHLSFAFDRCHYQAERNQELILTHLIPARIPLGQFPSPYLLQRFPRIKRLYGTFLDAIRAGDVKAYDKALERIQSGVAEGEEDDPMQVDGEFRMKGLAEVDVGVWMALERGREICLRGLMRSVWLASDKSSRVSIEAFQTAMTHQGLTADLDEVECIIAGMIWKGYMKGYISHEKRVVVLSKNGPFPPLKSRARPTTG